MAGYRGLAITKAFKRIQPTKDRDCSHHYEIIWHLLARASGFKEGRLVPGWRFFCLARNEYTWRNLYDIPPTKRPTYMELKPFPCLGHLVIDLSSHPGRSFRGSLFGSRSLWRQRERRLGLGPWAMAKGWATCRKCTMLRCCARCVQNDPNNDVVKENESMDADAVTDSCGNTTSIHII